ncbi:MAG: winged helix-turn-helix domain-containing tetratricopeptide repeat protein [Pseudomonadota bacterium]
MIFSINGCTVDTVNFEIRRLGQPVPVEPQVFDLLVLLIENRDRLVSKDEIVDRIWQGRLVSEAALSSRIKAVRQAIGDDGAAQTCIRTIRQRGFRVVADVAVEETCDQVSKGSGIDAETVREAQPARKERSGAREKPAIAVLPFVNMSGDPAQDYFSDGISEDIITALSRLRWFLVISRQSSFVYRGSRRSIREIGAELDVDYVLQGSVRKAGNRVRVTAVLVDAATEVEHWAEKYDHEVEDVFALQDAITQNVTSAIEPKLVAAEQIRTENRSADDLGAWGLVMRAVGHYGRMTRADTEKAIEVLRSAVEQYPDYGPANSLLAFAIMVSGHVGWTPESREYEYAAKLARRALEIDHDDPWAHMALGYVAFIERKTAEGVREFSRAIDLNPNFATAYGYLGWCLVFDGQSEEAIGNFEEALRMSPYDPLKAFFYSGTGVAHYYAERYEEAEEWARRAIRERPEFAAAHRILVATLGQNGTPEAIDEAMEKIRDAQPNISISWVEEHVPYTLRAMPHFIDGLRKAGLE